MVDKELDYSISILVIDGDEVSRRLLCDTLEALGFKILQTDNLSDAWNMLAAQKIDLLMIDVMVPEGNGIEFMMRLKKERPQMPVIVLTPVLDGAAKEGLLQAGADGVLTKPFRINLVEELITATLLKYDKASLSSPISNRKILIVDDDDSLLSFLTEAMKALGYDVVACRNGASAKEAFARDKFDLVISDFMLPDTSGIILFNELKSLNPSMPIVIVTGYPLAYTPAMARADGIDGYLGKPFRINQLEQVIAGLLSPENAPKKQTE